MLVDQFDGILLDVDGVVLLDGDPLPEARDALLRLQEQGKEHLFLTNNSRSTRRELLEQLRQLGVPVSMDDIISAGWATAHHLADEGVETAFVVGSSGFQSEIRGHGIDLVEQNADAVVVGLDFDVEYGDIETASREVMRGAQFVAANADPVYPTADGLSPGTGSIVRAIEAVSDTSPAVIGKPHPRMFEIARARFAPDQRVVMIGDNPDVDIRGAHQFGLPAILVSSGSQHDVSARGDIDPDATIAHLGELFTENRSL